MDKRYVCTQCGTVVTQEELITVENTLWRLKPIDDECCPHCKNLCIEIVED